MLLSSKYCTGDVIKQNYEKLVTTFNWFQISFNWQWL